MAFVVLNLQVLTESRGRWLKLVPNHVCSVLWRSDRSDTSIFRSGSMGVHVNSKQMADYNSPTFPVEDFRPYWKDELILSTACRNSGYFTYTHVVQ
jgi:hypothetical protein